MHFIAYIVCAVSFFFGTIVAMPLMLVLLPLERLSQYVGILSSWIESAVSVALGVLFCVWMDVTLSPLMFLFPLVMSLGNDIQRIQRAKSGQGPGTYTAIGEGQDPDEAIRREVLTEKCSAIGGVLGIVTSVGAWMWFLGWTWI